MGQRDLQRQDACDPRCNMGTYVWAWGTGANQDFTLEIP